MLAKSASRARAAPTPRPLVLLCMLYAVALTGRFSSNPLSSAFAGDIRLDLLLLLTPAAVLWIATAGARGIRRPTVAVTHLGPLLALFAYQASSCLWTPSDARVGARLMDLATLAWLLLLLTTVAPYAGRRAIDCLHWFMWLAACVYSLAAFASGPGAQGRFAALGGGPNVFVRVMLLGVLAAVTIYAKSHRNWVILPVPIFLAAALLSGSRGGLLAGLFVGMLAVGARWMRLSAARTLRVMGAVLALSLPIYYLVGGLLSSFVQSRFLDQTLAGKYTSGRPQLLQEAGSLFWSRPVIGVGLDGYYGYVGSIVGVSYPHNLVAAIAAEGGILGLLLLGNVFVRWGKALRRATPLTLDTRSCVVGAVFVFAASMFSGDYYDARFGWIYLLLGGASAAQDFAQRVTTQQILRALQT